MPSDLPLLLAAFVAAGLFAGFIGGLFGVGGGIVLTPTLYHLLVILGVSEEVRMHVAIATTLSTIIATSWRSLSTHAKSGAVDFALLRAWGPWIAAGAVVGSLVAGLADTHVLILIFGFGLLAAALNLFFIKDSFKIAEDVPHGVPAAALASGVGGLSAMMGIGGGTFGVTIMTLCGRTIHQAVATASGFGAAIAVPATLGYIITGWGHQGLPPYSLGYVNAPGFVVLALLTSITAPFGARAAHRLDRTWLKRAFAVFLAITAANMLRQAF